LVAQYRFGKRLQSRQSHPKCKIFFWFFELLPGLGSFQGIGSLSFQVVSHPTRPAGLQIHSFNGAIGESCPRFRRPAVPVSSGFLNK
jgi:hypothetical protein